MYFSEAYINFLALEKVDRPYIIEASTALRQKTSLLPPERNGKHGRDPRVLGEKDAAVLRRLKTLNMSS